MAEPLLRLSGVGKTYRSGVAALDGIDLEIAAGGFLSLLGPSGCGKSTLLRIIAGLAEASAGERRWTGDAPSRGAIGFVFQEPTLMPWATVESNIFLPLRLAGISRKAAAPRIADAIAAVGLEGFAAAYPRELSGGMRMRVSIARAFVTRPRLLLLDEPFAALDEITRLKLNEDLLRLWQSEGWTVVFVTHSVFESVFLSQRIIVMTNRPGRIAGDFAIDLPYPRATKLRMTPQYGAWCAAVSERLGAAVTAGTEPRSTLQ
ncbi:MAG: ABC transporter ATP-binding protein [Alphaproteobacteria bacterium]|nr:ABC transporter ATP-binding protein [Alphaproteobacteria bacterium]